MDATGAEKGTLADLLARPYPTATAGIPQELHYDPDAREFLYRFAEDPERRIADPTIVFVPAARHYPRGVVIETSPGDVARFDPTRNRLVIRRDASRATHTVRLRPAP